jgi:hypothetical protein
VCAYVPTVTYTRSYTLKPAPLFLVLCVCARPTNTYKCIRIRMGCLPTSPTNTYVRLRTDSRTYPYPYNCCCLEILASSSAFLSCTPGEKIHGTCRRALQKESEEIRSIQALPCRPSCCQGARPVYQAPQASTRSPR